MDFNYKKTTINHKCREYTIIIPSYEFKHTYICEVDVNDFYVFSSKEDFFEMSKAFSFCAKNQEAMLYIPYCNAIHPFLSDSMPHVPIGLDLLCVGHTLQFRQKEWKNVRGKIKKILTNQNVQMNNKHTEQKDLMKFHYKENKDHLDLYMNFATLILTGSKETFSSMGQLSLEVSKWKYDTSGLAHYHLSHLFKWCEKIKELKEVTFSLVEPADSD